MVSTAQPGAESESGNKTGNSLLSSSEWVGGDLGLLKCVW